jgi:hypothetical protein
VPDRKQLEDWAMDKILKEFRDFAMKGNVVDLAIGVVIGAAFGQMWIRSSTTFSCPLSVS